MEKALKYYSILLIISLASCESCETCDAELIEVGELFFQEESLVSLPYSGAERIVYVNEAGEEHAFRSLRGWELFDFQLIDEIVCSSQGIFPRSTFTYFKSQLQTLDYRAENTSETISLRLIIRSTDINNEFFGVENLYDGLDIAMRRVDTSYGSLHFLWHDRTNSILDMTDSPLFAGRNFSSDTTLLGRSFEDVYWNVGQLREDELFTALFFNRQMGVVAFVDYRYELWVLDRIE
jgi:hypothetical protein